MDSLYLPYLKLEDTLDLAFDLMFQTDSRAIILNRYDSYKIYTNEAVVNALAAPRMPGGAIKTCANLSEDIGIKVIELAGLSKGLSKWLPTEFDETPRAFLERIFENQFNDYGADYGIIFPYFRPGPVNLMMVITRHEGKRDEIVDRKKSCICNGPLQHTASDKKTGDPCDVDPSERYRCI